MSNTSATGGYLAGQLAPLADDELDDAIQAAVASISGLPGDLVRPRWQPTPPKTPEPDVNWIALGVTSTTPDAGPYIHHDGAGDGVTHSQRHAELELLVSCYGPQAVGYANLLRDGFGIPQNMEALKRAGLGFVDTGAVRRAPELVNQQWYNRADFTLRFRVATVQRWAVLSVLEATLQLNKD